MKPIPKSLLIHTIILHKKTSSGGFYEEPSLSNGTDISCVRMEPLSKIVRDKNNAEIQLSAILFYDCKNSCPRGTTFSVDDVISFNGQKYRVKVVEPLYDRKKLHHYEIGLIAYA